MKGETMNELIKKILALVTNPDVKAFFLLIDGPEGLVIKGQGDLCSRVGMLELARTAVINDALKQASSIE